MKRSTALEELSMSFRIIVESLLFNINSILTILFGQIMMVIIFLNKSRW